MYSSTIYGDNEFMTPSKFHAQSHCTLCDCIYAVSFTSAPAHILTHPRHAHSSPKQSIRVINFKTSLASSIFMQHTHITHRDLESQSSPSALPNSTTKSRMALLAGYGK